MGEHNMKKAPQKIKLDKSKLLGHDAQGSVMAGVKPVGRKPNAPKPSLDMSKLLGCNAQGTVMAGSKPTGSKPTSAG
jgi:hypothetical protein